MEVMVEVTSMVANEKFDVGSTHWVDVTHINNPHSFFVRPSSYGMFMPFVHAYSDQVNPEDLQLGQMVVYTSITNRKNNVRGRVLSIQTEGGETTCDVFTPDYGSVETSIPLDRIRTPLHSANVPPLALHCRLADCKPLGDTWSGQETEAMKFYIGKEQVKMEIMEKNNEGLIVILNSNECPDDIATTLALTGFTMLGHGANVVSRLSAPTPEENFFRFKELKVGDELNVRVQSGDSLASFYVASGTDYKHYLNERDNFTYTSKKKNDLRDEDVKVGLPVGVFTEIYMNFERAVIKEITEPGHKVKVQLVDWGKTIETYYARLKPMSAHFFSYPATAIYCRAEENQAWDKGLQKFLHPGYEFKITVVEAGNKFDSPNVVKISRLS